jgi:hypothetical protein
MKSPEETEHYACPSCGNTRFFVGYDDRGYPGPDECECGKNTCDCEVTLEQHFTVHEDGSIDYQAFEGGGRGAEIGSYTRIRCAACKELIWAPLGPQSQRRGTMTDPTASARQALVAEINARPQSRKTLEAAYGQVWDAAELSENFDVVGFGAPFVVVIRKSDRVKGSLQFQHSPRFYYAFQSA